REFRFAFAVAATRAKSRIIRPPLIGRHNHRGGAIMPRHTNSLKFLTIALAAAAIMLSAQNVSADVLGKVSTVAGIQLQYKVVLPNGYDRAKAYPAILAFGGGSQDMDMVQATLDRNWREQAENLGYIVILPAAPNGDLFFEEGARVFP